jgi:hypothetical protein
MILGAAATVAMCAAAGVLIVRVNDVAEMVDVVKVVNTIWRWGWQYAASLAIVSVFLCAFVCTREQGATACGKKF